MPIVNYQNMMLHAKKHQYAIPSFEINCLNTLHGALSAAEQHQSPVIFIIPEVSSENHTTDLLSPSVEAAASAVNVPITIQSQIRFDQESAIQAINTGGNSLVINSPGQKFDTWINDLNKISQICHSCGVPIEVNLTNSPDLELNQLKQINTDSMHISSFFFNNHINELKNEISAPLSIDHDASLEKLQYKHLLENGIAKVNFKGILLDTLENQIRQNCNNNLQGCSGLMERTHTTIQDMAARCIEYCQSTGKAEDQLENCTPWAPIEHLIIFNVSGIDDQQAQAMMAEGKESLSTLPGVRSVVTATAVKEDAQFRFGWLIRFCHPAVIDSYRDHPVHVDFADRLFRPVAGDRISIDYQWNS